MRAWFFPLTLIFVLALYGCSIDISQPSAATQDFEAGSAPEQNTSATSAPSSTEMPVTWASLKLSGKLVYVDAVAQDNELVFKIQALNLITGIISTIYQIPAGGWSDAVTVSPDGKHLIMAYSLPINDPNGGRENLYSMPVDASQPPQLLFTPLSDTDQYFQPAWSPDGKYVYFTRITDQSSPPYEIMRVVYPDGKPEKLVDHANQPRISGNGSQLVYVSLDPQTWDNQLFLANADGTDAHQVPLNDLPVPMIIDAPFFSPDDQSIFFSTPLGMQALSPKHAHKLTNVSRSTLLNGALPSEWWSVPLSGGKPTQLTNLQSSGLYGTFSPDEKYIASYSSQGIFVMKPDGTNVTMIISYTGGITGTVSWIP